MINPNPLTNPDDIKVFILYLLDRVGYPLRYERVAEIVVQDGIVNFIDFGKYFHELLEDGHITELANEPDVDEDNPMGHPTYTVSDTGKVIARELQDRLFGTVRERSYQNAIRYLDFAKRGATVTQTCSMEGDRYIFHCDITDREGTQMELSIRADSEYQLKQMKMTYSNQPEIVFRGIMALLTGEVNYLFTKD